MMIVIFIERRGHMDSPAPSGFIAAATAAAMLTPAPISRSKAPLQLPGGARLWLEGPAGRLSVLRAGQGPAVLLVHGWEGHASDMAGFIPGLLEAGLSVVVPDLPAHGASAGEQASIPLATSALLAVQAVLGDFHAVIAHSIGCAVSVEAMARGLRVGRAVLIASPARYSDHLRGVAANLGLSPAQTAELAAELLRRGVDVDALDSPRAAHGLRQPVLLLHSADDRVVPIRTSMELAAAWPGAQLRRLDGLGHRRILAAPEVVEAALAFAAA
jgi:pimeloyl-ACP methyl ester carboxylesterase